MEATVEIMFPGSLPDPVLTLVCLPGMGRTGAMYSREWFTKLGNCGVRILTVTYATSILEDMIAIGETAWKALDTFGFTQPLVLLGYSMGGFVMETMVHQRPKDVSGLIFVSTSIPTLSTFAATHIHDNMTPSAAQYLKYIRPKSKINDPDTSSHLSSENFRRESVAIIAFTVSNLASVFIKEARCPALVVYGTKDAIIPYSATVELQGALEGVPLTMHALDASHFVFVEQSNLVENAIMTWLKSTFSSTYWTC